MSGWSARCRGCSGARGFSDARCRFRDAATDHKHPARSETRTLADMTPAFRDDDLSHFEEHGAAPLPASDEEGYVEHGAARIWHASWARGPCAILLHGGLGHSGNWGYQVPVLVDAGYRVVAIDSRGHGRSSRDGQAFSYELMAADVLAVMDTLQIGTAAIVGWSDGACTGMVLARQVPTRIAGVFFFACNMDPSGTKPFEATPTIDRCFARHVKDYAALSPTPDGFEAFSNAVGRMQKTEPNYRPRDLAEIGVPVAIAQAEHDEFIRPEHAVYLARTIPGAELVPLPGVSHFAPLQRPEQFNRAVLRFLGEVF